MRISFWLMALWIGASMGVGACGKSLVRSTEDPGLAPEEPGDLLTPEEPGGPSPVEISLSPVSDINRENVERFVFTGTCAPNEAAIRIDVGDNASAAAGLCVDGAFTMEADLSALADGNGIEVRVTLTAGDGQVATDTRLVDKNTAVGLTLDEASLATIRAANANAYALAGTCVPDDAVITVDFAGVIGVASTRCGENTSGNWSLMADFSAVDDGQDLPLGINLNDGAGNTTSVTAQVDKKATSPSISVSNAPDINAVTQTAWRIDGGCVADGDAISVRFGELDLVASTSCGLADSGRWSVELDVSAAPDGQGIPLSVEISDGINPSVQALATVDKVTDLAAVVLDDLGVVRNENQRAYPIGGGCSPDGADIAISFGSLAGVGVARCGATATGRFAVSVDTSSEPDADAIRVVAAISDGVSNGNDVAQVAKDVLVPAVGVSALADIVSANVTRYPMDGTCDDARARIGIEIAGETFEVACDGARWSLIANLAMVENGIGIPVFVSATDPVGNRSEVVTRVNKDASLPFDAAGWTMDPPSGSTSTNFAPEIFQSGIEGEEGTLIRLFEDGECAQEVDRATVAAGGFLLTGISYATDGSQDGIHRYYAIVSDATGNVRPCFDTGLRYTLRSPGLGTQPLLALLGNGNDDAVVVTLEAGTTFTYRSADGARSINFGAAEDPAGKLFTLSNTSQGDRIEIGSGGVMGFTRIGATGLPWASEGYAGNHFIYNVRNGQSSARIIIAALDRAANVTVTLTNGQVLSPSIAEGSVQEIELTGLTEETGVVITSDSEVVVGAYSGSGVDNMLLSAVGRDMIAVGFVRALEANTTLNIYNGHNSNFDSRQSIAESGGSAVAGNLLNANPIGSVAARVQSDKLISAYDRADGDGGDGVSGINVNYLATHYALPEKADYIMVVALESGTVTVDEPGVERRVLNMTRDGSANPLAPWYLGDGANLDAGTTLTCSTPCAIIYDEFTSGDEEFLLGFSPSAP